MSSATVTRISNDWLGVLPGTWSRFPFQVVFSERKEPSTQTDAHLTPSQKFGVMPQADYMEFTGNRVVLNLAGADNMRHVEPGDFISHLRSFQGGLEYSALSGKVSAAYTVIAPEQKIVPDYFRHLFKSAAFIQALQSTTDQLRDGQSIRFGELKLVELPYPPVDVQRAIADFLDRETAEIDEFVAESEKLITLLNERRAAVITRAFSDQWKPTEVKRLEPSVESGVSVNGHSVPAESGEIGVLKTGAVSRGYFNPDENKRVVEWELDRVSCPVRAGSLIVNRANTPELVGQSGFVANDHPTLFLSDKLWQMKFSHALASYVHYWTQTEHYRGQVRVRVVGASSSMQNLSYSDFLTLQIPLAPLEHQPAIVKQLDSQMAKIDEAIATAREAIALAKERRQALISAAVTGKIDVRAAA